MQTMHTCVRNISDELDTLRLYLHTDLGLLSVTNGPVLEAVSAAGHHAGLQSKR